MKLKKSDVMAENNCVYVKKYKQNNIDFTWQQIATFHHSKGSPLTPEKAAIEFEKLITQ